MPTHGPVIFPLKYQPAIPLEKLILKRPPVENAIVFDVVFVGAGPAGLAGAIALKKKLPNLEIAVFEKAGELGEHCLSGAIVDPRPLLQLFPDESLTSCPFYSRVEEENLLFLTESDQIRIPIPRVMRNRGNFVASICEIVCWLGEKAKKLGVQVFTGFPVESLLMSGEQIVGVRTAAGGLNRKGLPGPSYLPPTDVRAHIVVLAEGTRGALTQAYLDSRNISSFNPQIYALGVKELWEIQSVPKEVIHTVGWPVPKDCFGGGWIYPMGKSKLSFGLVIGLDYPASSLDVHQLLQRFKGHSVLRQFLVGGKLLEWGAKTIPEGGFYSLPENLHGDGILITGDAAGFVNVASLKGIHYAVQSGLLAAEVIEQAFQVREFSSVTLAYYDRLVNHSLILKDLYRSRNMRLAFKSGFYKGAFKAELMDITDGKFPKKRLRIRSDVEEPKRITEGHAESVALKKIDAVFYSGNKTRDDIPQHLIVSKDIPIEIAEFYSHLCPAGVYEREGDKLIINSSNCIDCKATDILGPRWMPREGGSGPRYRKM